MRRFFERIKSYIFNKQRVIVDLRNEMVDEPLIESLDQYSKEIVLLKIPIDKCVSGIFWKLDKSNPFVSSLYLEDENILKTFYDEFQPSTINELFSIDLDNEFGVMSPYSFVFPWDEESPTIALKRREIVALRENARYSLKDLTLQEGGHTDFGPVNFDKLEIEKMRIKKLFSSIQTDGFKEDIFKNDGGIKGYFLLNKTSDWRFFITSGKHRAYVLSALGYDEILVILNVNKKTIRLGSLDEWPQVISGNYTERLADIVFNKFFR